MYAGFMVDSPCIHPIIPQMASNVQPSFKKNEDESGGAGEDGEGGGGSGEPHSNESYEEFMDRVKREGKKSTNKKQSSA